MQPTLNDLFGLHAKVGVVTGAARGIGLGIAQAMSYAGATVVLADRNFDLAKSSAEAINQKGGCASAFAVDVADEESVKRLIENTIRDHQRIDILVNNAGIFPNKSLRVMDSKVWDELIAVNLRGSFLTTKYAAEEMIRVGAGGRIINISSINTVRTYIGMAHYDASKAGIEALTRASALEFAPFGITVNAIAPGAVKSPGAMANLEVLEMISGVAAEAAEAEFAKKIPLRRWADPSEIGFAALCLTGAAAGYVTGQTVYVDGGLQLGL